MAIGRLLPTGTRGPSIRKSLVVYPWRGRLVERSWPKKRGRKLHPKVREQVEWFREAVQLAKYADPESQRRAIEWSKGTGLYPRDLIVHAMAGNLLEFADENDNVYKKHIFSTESVMFQGARVVRTSALSIAAGVATPIPWQSPILQTTPLWSPGNPTRITIPADVEVISLFTGAVSTSNTTGQATLWISKNGTGIVSMQECETTGSDSLCTSTGPIPVVEGDYFEANIQYTLAHTLSVFDGTFFSVNLLQVK